MLLPAIQYGTWKQVKVRMRAVVRRVKRGEDLVTVLAEGGMLDTATTEGMLIPQGTGYGVNAFFVHQPWKMLHDALHDIRIETDEALAERIFRSSMSVPWGVLGFLTVDNTIWFWRRKTWYLPFVEAAANAWDEISAVGPRYLCGFYGQHMWQLPNSLTYVLVNLGVPAARFDQPMPPGGPRALLDDIPKPN